MRKQMSDYPTGGHDDLTDAVNMLSVKRPGWPRRLYKTANWLLTIILLTVVPVVVGYANTTLVRYLVNATETNTTPLLWNIALWFLGFEMLAALAIGIIGAAVLIQTTHKA